jgi:WS/DGAT/MGAT family acyltransferase
MIFATNQPMNSSDALIWHAEADPVLRSTVSAVWFLADAPHPQRMRATVERMVADLPRFRQRVVDARPRPYWRPVAEVDIDAHYEYRTLPDGASRDDVMRLAEAAVAEPFDRSRPLWQVTVVDGLPDGGAALMIKVHHAIADGIGLVLMLGALVDFEPDPAVRIGSMLSMEGDDEPRPRRPMSAALRAAFVRPVQSARNATKMVVSATRLVLPTRRPLSPTMRQRSGQFTLHTRRVPLATLRGAGKSVGGTLNDAFVAVVLDAIDRYHVAAGSNCERIRVHMPINIRNDYTATAAGNLFVPARVVMPTKAMPAAERVRRVHRHLAKVRAEPALPHVNTVSALIQKLGVPISWWIIGGMMKGVDVLASNVPGPQCPLFVSGVRIDEFYAFGPPAGAALNVTLFSFDGVASLGVTVDGGAVDDATAFMACLDEAVAALAPAPHSAPTPVSPL